MLPGPSLTYLSSRSWPYLDQSPAAESAEAHIPEHDDFDDYLYQCSIFGRWSGCHICVTSVA